MFSWVESIGRIRRHPGVMTGTIYLRDGEVIDPPEEDADDIRKVPVYSFSVGVSRELIEDDYFKFADVPALLELIEKESLLHCLGLMESDFCRSYGGLAQCISCDTLSKERLLSVSNKIASVDKPINFSVRNHWWCVVEDKRGYEFIYHNMRVGAWFDD
jgi:hypothetical protein